MRSNRVFRIAGITALIAAVAFVVARGTGRTWDFAVFYLAARALRHGLDPYSLADLAKVARQHVSLPFLYPPVTLALFVPVSGLPFHIAARIWLSIQLGLAAVLLHLWWRVFLGRRQFLLLLAVAVLAFDAPLLWDFNAGNVAIVEALLLWSAFAFYLQDRRELFAVLLAAASVFKLIPIVFLALLFVPSAGRDRDPKIAMTALLVFAILVFGQTLAGLPWAHGYLHNVPADRPYGEINPCALGLFDGIITGPRHSRSVSELAIALWIGYVVAILLVSRRALSDTWRRRDPLRTVVVAALLFAVISPRMMIYSYLLLVVPSVILIPGLFPGRFQQAMVWTLLFAQGAARVFTENPNTWPWLGHLPFLLALAIWLVFVGKDGRLSGDEVSTADQEFAPIARTSPAPC